MTQLAQEKQRLIPQLAWNTSADHFSVTGLVEREIAWSLYDFESNVDSFTVQTDPLHPRAPKRIWTGISTERLVSEITPLPHAQYVEIIGLDGYRITLSLSDFRAPNNMIAIALDAEYLTAEQGGPLRFIMPKAEACLSIKTVKTLRII